MQKAIFEVNCLEGGAKWSTFENIGNLKMRPIPTAPKGYF
jgi:hypothetical protein